MINHTYSSDFVHRYNKFLKSEESKKISDYAKSHYWRAQAQNVKIQVRGDNIGAIGESGFYVKSRPSMKKLFSVLSRLAKAENPLKATLQIFRNFYGKPRSMLTYGDAFELTMETVFKNRGHRQSLNEILRSIEHPRLFLDIASCEQDSKTFLKSESFSDHIIASYYYFNILNLFIDFFRSKHLMIVEIGAGSANLLALLHKKARSSTLIDIDLPETLSHTILHTVRRFPEATILLPNEIKRDSVLSEYDFVFMTPAQLDFVSNDSADLFVNTHSFQEMQQQQIHEYFHFIQRSGKDGALFFTANRVEKTPFASNKAPMGAALEVNRFSDYPWNKNNQILLYEICEFFRLIQLDAMANRLEKIIK